MKKYNKGKNKLAEEDINLRNRVLYIILFFMILSSAIVVGIIMFVLVIYHSKDIDESLGIIIKSLPFVILTLAFFVIAISYVYVKFTIIPLISGLKKSNKEILLRRNFMGAVSHELKTPITIISGQLEGMIYKVGKFKDRDTYLKKTYESVNGLKELVDDMLDVSRSDFYDINLNLGEVCVNEIIEVVLDNYSSLIESKNMTILKYIGENTIINSSRNYTYTIVKNVIHNAIKYSPSNETIIISVYEYEKFLSPTYIRFTVENTGVTIKDDNIKNLFQPFYRVDESRNRDTGGTGLGLYLVSELLNKQGYKYKIFCKENSTIFQTDMLSFKKTNN